MLKKGKIAVIVSEFNKQISYGLLKGFEEEIKKHEGIRYEVFWVPGAFEIPLKAKRLAKDYDVLLALGCVLQGETYHFELVANECARGCMEVMLSENRPVVFEVLACYTEEEAIERSSGEGNKGRSAAVVAVEWMLNGK